MKGDCCVNDCIIIWLVLFEAVSLFAVIFSAICEVIFVINLKHKYMEERKND